jgi:hypothetical protein
MLNILRGEFDLFVHVRYAGLFTRLLDHFDPALVLRHPPDGDKTVFVDTKYKGHLRGRAALIGSVVYGVIYHSANAESLSNAQFSLLRRTYLGILSTLANKHPNLSKKIQDAVFIEEDGETLAV